MGAPTQDRVLARVRDRVLAQASDPGLGLRHLLLQRPVCRRLRGSGKGFVRLERGADQSRENKKRIC